MYDCNRCGHWCHAAPELAALTLPEVVGFHGDHGIYLREPPGWALEWLEIQAADVASRNPVKIAVTVTLDSEAKTFEFDRTFDLLDVVATKS